MKRNIGQSEYKGMVSKAVLASAIALLPIVGVAAVPAIPAVNVQSISKYVYPGNTPANPGKMSFMPDGESYLRLEDEGRKIVKYETSTGKVLETVLDTSHTRENSISAIEDFTISPDGSKLLVMTDSRAVYRHSMQAAWYVFEIKRNILRPLSKTNTHQQSPLFSPDGRMVAFVMDNNIYIKKIDYDSEVAVTADGLRNSIINGVPDWTYEEEFSTSCSMAWAPDCTTLCFLRYDESAVPVYNFTLYQGWCSPQDNYALYPGEFSYKYPVAGQSNSVVSVHSYDVETRKTKEIPLKDKRIEYIPRIAFGGGASDRLMVVTLDRAQSRMEIYAANPKSTVVKSVLVEEAKAWLNPMAYENLSFATDGFVVLSERTGFNQAYKYSYNGQLLRCLSSGEADVTAYYGEDLLGNVYYQAVPSKGAPANAINRQIFKTDKAGKKIEALSPETGWGEAVFTPTLNYYMLSYSDAATPAVYTLYSGKGKKQRVVEDNASYASSYTGIPVKEFFTFQSDGNTLNGFMIKPSGFNPSRKYPVIMWQYSGPGSQEVVNRWKMDWGYYAAEQGFLVVCVDGRGTGARGTAFRDVVYKRLGYYETVDQTAAARYVASLPYADASRIGICGWSYGGYETLMAVTAQDSPFAAAVAIAPVTSWRYYDTVYAERYMLTPQENPDGYDESAPISRAARLACPLLIMHGTADDNVHLQNTVEFASSLQANDRYCDLWLFPAMNHSINGCDARAQVYGRMISYFQRNL